MIHNINLILNYKDLLDKLINIIEFNNIKNKHSYIQSDIAVLINIFSSKHRPLIHTIFSEKEHHIH